MNDKLPDIPSRYLERVRALLSGGQRKILGLVGPPGCGKSTLAAAIHHAFPGVSQVVPMDGFHLANVELRRLGRSGRKGAPDTFDSEGYAALLRRLRSQRLDEVVYAPEFRRALEEPVAGAIPVSSRTQLVITEGNYLLLRDHHWAAVAPMLDDVWYVDVDDDTRIDRLARRHEMFGRSRGEALEWVAATDEPNARLIATTRSDANLVFRWDDL